MQAQRSDMVAGDTDKNLIILESLICLLREKHLLTRSDVEDLCDMVQKRVAGIASELPACSPNQGAEAVSTVTKLTNYIGRRYGGRRRR